MSTYGQGGAVRLGILGIYYDNPENMLQWPQHTIVVIVVIIITSTTTTSSP